MRKVQSVWLAAPCLVLVACSAAVAPPEELQAARNLWEANGPSAYTYDHRLSCECGPHLVRPVRLEVVDGRVTGAVFTDADQPVPEGLWADYPTVEDLFERVVDAIDQKAHSLFVRYDAALGYPSRLSVDYDPEIADDEFSLAAENLAPLGD